MKFPIRSICAVVFVLAGAASQVEASAASPAGERWLAPRAAIPVAAQKCKYKTDGTGNCLSPAFYKCQRDWKKCNDACKSNVACLDKCEVKYAAQCGD